MGKLANRTTSLALLVIGALTAMTCVSAIGAVTTLVVMATNAEEALVPHDRDCAVVAWKSGEVHCFRGVFAGTGRAQIGELAVVTPAGAAH